MTELTGDDRSYAEQGATLLAEIRRLADRQYAPTRTIEVSTDYARPRRGREFGDAGFNEALQALDVALRLTIKHMKEQKAGKATSLSDDDIAEKWADAASKIAPYDSRISDACMMKGNGWIDSDVWVRAEEQGIKIGIKDMEEARMALNGLRPSRDNVPSWFPIAGVLFAVATVAFLMYIFVAGLPVDESRRLILNVLVAFCVAASAAFLGGTAAAKGKIPLFKDSPIQFSAVGGIGVFVVVLLVMKYAV